MRGRAQADAYGHAIHDWHRGLGGYEIIERDDGFVGITDGPAAYFAEHPQWPARERQALRAVRGRVLDAGCGAGRIALHLQERGHEVVAIDSSPLAVRTAELRGVERVHRTSLARASGKLGTFDTIVLFGNNFGLLETPERARVHLRRLRRLAEPGARILAESTEPRHASAACHLRHRRRNVARGRLPGQSRIRIRYLDSVTPWFDYLLASRKEIPRILTGTGWRLERCIGSEAAFIAVIASE